MTDDPGGSEGWLVMEEIRTSTGTSRPEAHGAPVFLLGPARSGTSLLYKLLCLHPAAAYISNYVARFPSGPLLAALDRIPRRFPERQRRVWFGGEGSNAYVYGGRRALGDRLFPMPVEGEPVFRRAGVPGASLPSPAERAAVAARLRSSVDAIRRASGGEVFINKRIANIFRVPLLDDAFPDARYVAMVRDGRAVALSLSRVDWWPTSVVASFGGTPERWAAEGGDPWELCARNWVDEVDAMEAGLEGVPDDRVLRVSYEELVEAPQQILGAIGAFSGLATDPGWWSRVDGVRFPDRNDAWRRDLTPAALATIDDVQGSTLERYGYER